MTGEKNCSVCGKPKERSGGGFTTQLVDVCACDSIDSSQSNTVTLCLSCGKRILVDSGSMTQWIVGSTRCNCENPKPSGKKEVVNFHQPAFTGHDDDSEEELSLTDDEFPVERFKPISVIGTGANGTVYLSRDRLLGKKVAIKLLHQLTSDQLVDFQNEARTTSKLNHTNVINIMDFGASTSGIPFMVMDYFDGITLQEYILEHGPISESFAAKLFLRVASALEHAHENSIYHRDIKPSNILVIESNDNIDARIIDFGIAKVKEATGSVTQFQGKTLAGTPCYMAPDPINDTVYDSSSEVYSLGCVLFESLTGEPPYRGETALETISLHAQAQIPKLTDKSEIDFSQEMESIVASCLAKDKSNRYNSMGELIEAFNALESLDSQAEGNLRMDASTDLHSFPSAKGNSSLKRRKLSIPFLAVLFLIGGFGFGIFCIAIWNYVSNERYEDDVSHEDPVKKYTKYTSEDKRFSKNSVIDSVSNALDGQKEYFGSSSIEPISSGYIVTNGNDQILEKLLERKQFQRLRFYDGEYSASAIKKLEKIPITDITVRQCSSLLSILKGVSSWKHLLLIRVIGCETQQTPELASSFNSTTSEIIFERMQLNSDISLALGQFKKLSSVKLVNCKGLEQNFSKISSPAVNHVILVNQNLNSDSFKSLHEISNLIELTLVKTPNFGSLPYQRSEQVDIQVYPHGLFKYLTRVSKLKRLAIRADQCDKTTFDEFSKLNQIESIVLVGRKKLPEGIIAKLASLKNLSNLEFYGKCIASGDIKHLSKFKSIRTLVLDCFEHDQVFNYLSPLRKMKLDSLTINAAYLGPTEVICLGTMKGLKSLKLRKLDNINALSELKSSLPNCNVSALDY